jgi:hypothetical protein
LEKKIEANYYNFFFGVIKSIIIYPPKGKFQDEIMRMRPRGSGTISALVSKAICGSLAYKASINKHCC